MSKKLVIYVDGSFKNEKGRWSYTYRSSNDLDEATVSYGSCQVVNNNQPEIIACIKALESLETNLDVEYVEIRSDYLDLVRVMNKVAQFQFMSFGEIKHLLGKENEKFTVILAKTIIECPYIIKFYKASKRDVLNRRVHNLAKRVIDEGPLSHDDLTENETFFEYATVLEEQNNNDFKKHHLGIWESHYRFSYKDIPNLKQQLIEIDVSKVSLYDDIHLKASSVEFDGLLYKASQSNQINTPIIVRRIGDDQYSLVLGLKSFCIAKMLGINKMKAYVTELSRRELIIRTLNEHGY